MGGTLGSTARAGVGETVAPGEGAGECGMVGNTDAAGGIVGDIDGAGVGETIGPGEGVGEGRIVGDIDGAGDGETVGPGEGAEGDIAGEFEWWKSFSMCSCQ